MKIKVQISQIFWIDEEVLADFIGGFLDSVPEMATIIEQPLPGGLPSGIELIGGQISFL